MKNILAFGASSSRQSINKKWASYVASQIKNANVNVLDLNDFEMTIYSIDKEKEDGIPSKAMKFKEHIRNSDGIIISFAEHNGAYSAAFKNIFDWVSRIEKDVWGNKPMFLMATSPGGRGGATVLEIAYQKMKRMTSSEVNTFSLPSFSKNFTENEGISDADLSKSFLEQLESFEQNL